MYADNRLGCPAGKGYEKAIHLLPRYPIASRML